jgi:lysophospholipase L1-like esterase
LAKKRLKSWVKITLFYVVLLVLIFNLIEYISSYYIDDLEMRTLDKFDTFFRDDSEFLFDINFTENTNYLHLAYGPAEFYVRNYTIPYNKTRIFLFGESSVAGGGNIQDVNDLLDFRMREYINNSEISVLNFGVGAIDSVGILNKFSELSNYKPKLAIIYAGHNDYWTNLENLNSDKNLIYNINKFFLRKSKFYRLIFFYSHKNKDNPNSIYSFINMDSIEQNFLIENNGWSHLDDSDYSKNIILLDDTSENLIKSMESRLEQKFEHNMMKIIDIARDNNITLVFVTPVSNPYVYEFYHAKVYKNSSLQDFKSKYKDAQQFFANKEYNETLKLLVELDRDFPENGLVSIFFARVYAELDNFEKVREYELKTIEFNYRTHKAKRNLVDIIKTFQDEKNNIYIYDFNDFFYYQQNISEPIESQFFGDYLHPNKRLYQLMSDKILEFIDEKEILELS